jgi:hypothetical protein
VLVGAVTRRPRLGWAVFAVYAAHVLFDAPGGGTPILWPLADVRELPWLACPAGIAVLFAISAVVARPGRARAPGAVGPAPAGGRVAA